MKVELVRGEGDSALLRVFSLAVSLDQGDVRQLLTIGVSLGASLWPMVIPFSLQKGRVRCPRREDSGLWLAVFNLFNPRTDV
jgi:hypothetical protein